MTKQLQGLDIGITTNTLCAGGAEMQRVLLANGLVVLGHSVTLYCLQNTGPLIELLNEGVSVVQAPFYSQHCRRHDALITGTTNTETVFGFISGLISRRSTCWIIAIHNPVGPTSPKLGPIAKLGLRLANSTIALNKNHAERISTYWRVRPTETVSNGVVAEAFVSTRQRRQTTTKFDFDIGFIGRISAEHKGLDILLEALSLPPALNLTLGIAGNGPDEEWLKSRARELNVSERVEWLGHQASVDFLARPRVLAVPSRYEGQPMVLLEAMAAAVPVLASAFAGADASDRVKLTDILSPSVVAEDLASMVQAKFSAGSTQLPPTTTDMVQGYLGVISRTIRRTSKLRPNRKASL